MINKKNVLGKRPAELGVKDAIHVAIVSMRAAKPIMPGERCGLNECREAIPDKKGPGVADPFLKSPITTGDSFWLLLAQNEVPNVSHVWEHPSIDFSTPASAAKRNQYLASCADQVGVTYEQLMEACANVIETGEAALYPGTKTSSELADILNDIYSEVWYEWSVEVGHEFDNEGSACCPEYRYPECLFRLSSEW